MKKALIYAAWFLAGFFIGPILAYFGIMSLWRP
jgi:hypothetical protein